MQFLQRPTPGWSRFPPRNTTGAAQTAAARIPWFYRGFIGVKRKAHIKLKKMWVMTRICNLLYRRIAFGRALPRVKSSAFAAPSRLKILVITHIFFSFI